MVPADFYETVKLLLDTGSITHNGIVLELAILEDNYDIVELLIEYGIDIYLRNMAAIHIAARYGRYRILQLLLDLSLFNKHDLMIDLSDTIYYNHYECANLLLNHGVPLPVCIVDNAVFRNYDVKLIKLLLDHAETTCYQGTINYAVTKLLLEYGFNFAHLTVPMLITEKDDLDKWCHIKKSTTGTEMIELLTEYYVSSDVIQWLKEN